MSHFSRESAPATCANSRKDRATELTSVARLIGKDPGPLFVLNLSGIRGEQSALGLNL